MGILFGFDMMQLALIGGGCCLTFAYTLNSQYATLKQVTVAEEVGGMVSLCGLNMNPEP